jgi:type II secretion system protein H
MSQRPRDEGFTLLEVLVTMAIMGMVLAFSVSGWSRYARAHEQAGTAQELRTTLRNVQQRAVTEGTSMCVNFTTTSYTVWRGTCTAGDRVQGPIQTNGAARLATPAFTPLTVAQAANTLVFTPRGTASTGDIHVTRPNSTKDYKIAVDGFTGRVSLCDESGCNGV